MLALSVLLLVVFALTGAGSSHRSAGRTAGTAGSPEAPAAAGVVQGPTTAPGDGDMPGMPGMPGGTAGAPSAGATPQVDTSQVDTSQVDTLHVDTLHVDTLHVDTLHVDTSHGGTDALGLGDEPAVVANLGVLDQVSDGRSMTVGVAEVTGTPGWVVVQRDVAGVPGAVVGLSRRLNGQHDDATPVTFTTPVTTGGYWVSLHRDLGQQHVYEYPGPDELATGAGAELIRRITLTVG